MIIIDGIQVDTTAGIDSLSNEWAVFTVEFEFDNRLMVCHTFGQSVYRGIKKLIDQTLSVKAKSIELRQALLNSRYITVNIEAFGLNDKYDVLGHKYKLIKSSRAYLPYGYNSLIGIGNSLEQSYADILLKSIIDEIDKNAAYPMHSIYSTSRKGKVSKPVYSYDRKTGLPVSEYISIKNAAEDTGICASNINMCCNGHIKSAGGYIWSYIRVPMFDTSRLKDNRLKDALLPSEEELVRRQQAFISRNQK